MPNQAYFDKIENYKKTIDNAAKCLPKGVSVVFDGEDEDYGIHFTINGISFSASTEECTQEVKTLVGTRTRTYEGWNAEIYNEYGESFIAEGLSEIATLSDLICECYLWTVRHVFDNKCRDYAIYSDWVESNKK